MDTPTPVRSDRSQNGFSVTELVVVVGIIGIMAAASIPAIASYIRNYRIRGGANEVASALQQARLKAITSNVNYGVLFVPLSATTFRVVREDGVAGRAIAGDRPDLSELLGPALVDEQASQLFELPQQVVFATAVTGCPELTTAVPPFVPSPALALRFNRLGAACEPSTTEPTCPEVDDGAAFFWRRAASSDVALCVIEQRTRVTRSVLIGPGGRVQVVQALTEANQ